MLHVNQISLIFLALAMAVLAGCETKVENASTPPAEDSHHTVVITTDNFREVVLNSDQPVLLDFWAGWCGPCHQIAPLVESMAKEYEGRFVVGKVNVDQQMTLATEFEIESIPALLYFKNGKLVKRTVGVVSESMLRSAMEEVKSL